MTNVMKIVSRKMQNKFPTFVQGIISVVIVGYLTTTMYYSNGQRPSPSVDQRYMVFFWMICDGYMITGDECGPNFLTFVLRLRKNPGKNLKQKIDMTGDRTQIRGLRTNVVTPRPQRWG